MSRIKAVMCLGLLLAWGAGTALASSGGVSDDIGRRRADAAYCRGWTGQAMTASKAAVDTIYLLGGPNQISGKFQRADGLADAQGWTGADRTHQPMLVWHIDTFNAELLDPAFTPNHAVWCGAYFPVCETEESNPGYGNEWDQWLDWYGTVPDPGQRTDVTATAVINYDVEPDYDYLYLQVERSTGMDDIASWTGDNRNEGTGEFVPEDVRAEFSAGTNDYVGENLDQVHLRWRAYSDTYWSDADCDYPSDGHSQLDNISVFFGGVLQSYEDFEGGESAWSRNEGPAYVGDFAKVWPFLYDIDICASNTTPRFAFIDDGVVVPGTGGSLCVSWCYGPGGYIVNLTGGLAGPDYHLWNEIWSPVLDWPAGSAGAILEFDYYAHQVLGTGLYWVWSVTSSDDGGATWEIWQDRGWVYYGGPANRRRVLEVTDLLRPTRNKVRIALGANEYGWIWHEYGTDGTPAPYFDNVSFKAFTSTGPGMYTRDIELANDAFPAIGVIDYQDLAANSVRFDMAMNISPSEDLMNDPGDSITFSVTAVRVGSVLTGPPEMYWKMKANPVFDEYRSATAPNPVPGEQVSWDGTPIRDRYSFDLPDTGFFFPGDVIHYFIQAQDNIAGEIGTSLMPGDTSGFSFFPGDEGYVPLRYPSDFIVNALPTLFSITPGDQPRILFWNDFGNRGGENEWQGALGNLGYAEGEDYDIYYTTGPSSGVGNGLGGRASSLQLSGYRTMLYTCGNLPGYTICVPDWNSDPSDDVGVVDGWLRLGDKHGFFTGDSLVQNLVGQGAAGSNFVNSWFGVNYLSADVRPLIGNQGSPIVAPMAGNSLGLTERFVAYGACPTPRNFDAVNVQTGTQRIAEFTSPTGATGQYSYAAGIYKPGKSDMVYLPYDLMSVYTLPDKAGAPAALSARAQLLEKVLVSFGHIGNSETVDVPAAQVLTAKCHPNPFNPNTTFTFTLPRDGQIELKIYNVRGELVRTLIDEVRAAGAYSRDQWDGTDNTGRTVASGVYFYNLQAAGDNVLGKTTMMK